MLNFDRIAASARQMRDLREDYNENDKNDDDKEYSFADTIKDKWKKSKFETIWFFVSMILGISLVPAACICMHKFQKY